MKVIAGDHIEAMLQDIRELLCQPKPDGRTIREVIDAHTVEMPDVVTRQAIVECMSDTCTTYHGLRIYVNNFPSWKPEDTQ